MFGLFKKKEKKVVEEKLFSEVYCDFFDKFTKTMTVICIELKETDYTRVTAGLYFAQISANNGVIDQKNFNSFIAFLRKNNLEEEYKEFIAQLKIED